MIRPVSLLYSVGSALSGNPKFNIDHYSIEDAATIQRNASTLGVSMAIGAAVPFPDEESIGVRTDVGEEGAALTQATARVEVNAAARKAADAAQAEGRTNGTAAALRTSDGRIFTDVSTGGATRTNHPEVQQALNNVPKNQQSDFHGCCAEIGNLNQAKSAGANTQGAMSATAKIRRPGHPAHGQPKAPCPTCQHVHKQEGVEHVN